MGDALDVENHRFHYFLKLDDDYFLCLQRLQAELEHVRDGLMKEAPYLYVGHAWNDRDSSRMDEAYLLMSAKIVQRVLHVPDLQCGAHAGLAAGWWFKKGSVANVNSDVRWVHDVRLDHFGKWWESAHVDNAKICNLHMGVHHTFTENMGILCAAAQSHPGVQPRGGPTEFQYKRNKYKTVGAGVPDHNFFADNTQPCRSFIPLGHGNLHCGAEGC